MNVPLIDLKRQYASIRNEVRQAVDEIFESQSFVLGKPVLQLEEYLAQITGVDYAIGVGSGTDALLLALKALEIGEGDEVITTPFTFFSTAGVVSNLGARPVFVDILPGSFNIDPALIEAAITKRTKAIIPVHLFGQPAEMEDICAIATQHKLAIVEDAAQALGAHYKGKPVCSFAEFGATSFFPTKNLGGAGEGGMIFSNDEKLAERARWLRVHGSHQQYLHEIVGTNSRLDALQAAVLLQKAPHLAKWSEQRRANAARYNTLLADLDQIKTPECLPERTHIYNQYTIRANDRDALQAYLRENGVSSGIYYPIPLHLQPCFSDLGYKEGDMPESERACKEVLSLPIFSELSEDELEFTAEQIHNFYKA